jgi:hypothetical protein
MMTTIKIPKEYIYIYLLIIIEHINRMVHIFHHGSMEEVV